MTPINPSQLVLLPGMDGTGDLFAEFLAALPPEIQTSVLRYPTQTPTSEAQLLAQIESAVPPAPYVLLAESFSTPLAIWHAAHHPENLKALILVAGFATSPKGKWTSRILSLAATCAFALPLTKPALKFLIGSSPSPSLARAVRDAIASVSPVVLASRLRALLSWDTLSDLAQVRVPILYLQAKEDRLVGPQSLAEMLRVHPGIEVTTIPGPHLILQREPVRSAEIVAGFLSRTI